MPPHGRTSRCLTTRRAPLRARVALAWLAAAAAPLAPAAVAAQRPAASDVPAPATPREAPAAAVAVADRALAALAAADWRAVAQLVDPVLLDFEKRRLLRQAEQLREAARQLPPVDPSLPPAVRDWVTAQQRAAAERALPEWAARELGPGWTLDSLRIASPPAVYARRLAVRGLGQPLRLQRLGALAEADGTVHVLARAPGGGGGAGEGATVLSLHLTPDGWRLWSGADDPVFGPTGLALAYSADVRLAAARVAAGRGELSWRSDGGGTATARLAPTLDAAGRPSALLLEWRDASGGVQRARIPGEVLPGFVALLGPFLVGR